MKKLLKKIFTFIRRLYSSLKDETKQYLPVAITVVEGIKKFIDSPIDDVLVGIVETVIPSLPKDKIALVRTKLEEVLPKILLEMNLINSIASIEDPNQQLQAILDALKLSSDDVKAEKYHTIASKILVVLSDGKVTWGEAVIFTEWYYQNYVKQ